MTNKFRKQDETKLIYYKPVSTLPTFSNYLCFPHVVVRSYDEYYGLFGSLHLLIMIFDYFVTNEEG